VPVTIIFNQHSRPVRENDPNFDASVFAKKTRAKDNSGAIFFKVAETNTVSYRFIGEPKISQGDHSLVEFAISPEKVGSFMMHVLIGKGQGAVEIAGSPFNVVINKSDTHRSLEEEKKRASDKLAEKKRKKEEENRRLKQEKEA